MHVDQDVAPAAYQMAIEDIGLQAYLQRWPFATGPHAASNDIAISTIGRALSTRPAAPRVEVISLDREQTRLSVEEEERLRAMFDRLHFDAARRGSIADDFGWESSQAPRTAMSVLDVGCGDGMELLFLRAVLPNAKMTAVDYGDSLTAEVKRIVDVELHVGDMNLILGSLPGGYDLIYSNHTLEHLYLPDQLLRTLYGLLAPGGSLVSTLPMDAQPGSPFLSTVARLAGSNDVQVLDVVYLDAGHPWKTNPADLTGTLRRAGFAEVTIYQRREKITRRVEGSRRALALGKHVGLALNFFFFSTVRGLIRHAIPARFRPRLARMLCGVERRVWFGSNNLKNSYTEEALVHATKLS